MQEPAASPGWLMQVGYPKPDCQLRILLGENFLLYKSSFSPCRIQKTASLFLWQAPWKAYFELILIDFPSHSKNMISFEAERPLSIIHSKTASRRANIRYYVTRF